MATEPARSPLPTAPSDAVANAVFNAIAELARAHALTVEVEGLDGCLLLARPEVQRQEGTRQRVLRSHGMLECEHAVAPASPTTYRCALCDRPKASISARCDCDSRD